MSTDTREFFPRYMLPLLPVLAILGGRVLDVLARSIGRKNAAVAGATVAIALCVLPFSRIAADNYWMVQKDTRAIDAGGVENKTTPVDVSREKPPVCSTPSRASFKEPLTGLVIGRS